MVTTTIEPRRSPSFCVVEAVAAVSDVPPTDLPALSDAVDTDALDTLFSNASGDRRLRFEYAGFEVGIDGDVVGIHDVGSAAD